jgi:hypothetical protein
VDGMQKCTHPFRVAITEVIKGHIYEKVLYLSICLLIGCRNVCNGGAGELLTIQFYSFGQA